MAHIKFTVASEFSVVLLCPLETWCGPLEGHMAHVENRVEGRYKFSWLLARPKNERIRRRKHILFISVLFN